MRKVHCGDAKDAAPMSHFPSVQSAVYLRNLESTSLLISGGAVPVADDCHDRTRAAYTQTTIATRHESATRGLLYRRRRFSEDPTTVISLQREYYIPSVRRRHVAVADTTYLYTVPSAVRRSRQLQRQENVR